ncbi:MAG: LytR/AlgR family response regulator transcription factor [Bacteroidia bacterium]
MSGKIKAIIVDDEESARNILFNLLQSYKNEIEIKALCVDVESAVEVIKQHQPDVVFLDIEMPNYSGLELVSFFEEINFEIIFVTAYNHFAVKAFEVAAFDYLLKPIELARLDTCIKNLIEKTNKNKDALNYQILKESLSQKAVQKMIVTHQGNQKALLLSDVIAIEANEAYTTVIDKNGNRYTISKNLKHFEGLFADNKEFFRSHKSWMVNYHHIIKYSNSDYTIYLTNNVEAKLSKYKKAEFDAWYKNYTET